LVKKKLRALFIQVTQAVLHKKILDKDTKAQKSHGKNLMGTRYLSGKVFI